MTDRELLTIDQAMQRAGVTRRSIYHWLEGGKVEYVRTAGGSVRIFADTLMSKPMRGWGATAQLTPEPGAAL